MIVAVQKCTRNVLSLPMGSVTFRRHVRSFTAVFENLITRFSDYVVLKGALFSKSDSFKCSGQHPNHHAVTCILTHHSVVWWAILLEGLVQGLCKVSLVSKR